MQKYKPILINSYCFLKLWKIPMLDQKIFSLLSSGILLRQFEVLSHNLDKDIQRYIYSTNHKTVVGPSSLLFICTSTEAYFFRVIETGIQKCLLYLNSFL